MGRFVEDETPTFTLVDMGGMPDRKVIMYDIAHCPRFYDEAIERTGLRHVNSLPYAVKTRGQFTEPWDRVMAISEECARNGVSLALNSTTMHGEFESKVYPTLFEMICLELWCDVEEVPYTPENPRASDAVLRGVGGDVRIEWKTKNRNVDPKKDYLITIPVTQGNQVVDLYCCGQTGEPYTDGYILGMISKNDFLEPIEGERKFYAKGDRDTNGVVYLADTYACQIRHLKAWKRGDVMSFPKGCWI